MPSLVSFTAALALLGGAAVSSPIEKPSSAFSVQQVQRSVFLKNGPALKVKTLEKFGKPVPQSLRDAAATRAADAETISSSAVDDNGSDPAVPSDQYDSSYLSPVTLGSNQVQLDFDTGSADLYVTSMGR